MDAPPYPRLADLTGVDPLDRAAAAQAMVEWCRAGMTRYAAELSAAVREARTTYTRQAIAARLGVEPERVSNIAAAYRSATS
jgi:uncharacterized protein YllA (UPF0747 family)